MLEAYIVYNLSVSILHIVCYLMPGISTVKLQETPFIVMLSPSLRSRTRLKGKLCEVSHAT